MYPPRQVEGFYKKAGSTWPYSGLAPRGPKPCSARLEELLRALKTIRATAVAA
jgi:hypothetical protein